MQYNSEEFTEILNIFKAESEEIIQKFNDRFMELEKNPDDKTPVKELMQLAHSLKGGARMIGFNSIQDIAHKLEDVLSCRHSSSEKDSREFFHIIYEVCDFLTEITAKSIDFKGDFKDDRMPLLLKKLESLIPADKSLKDDKNALGSDYLIKKEMDINAALLELIFVIEKEDTEENFSEASMVLKENLELLFEIFELTRYTEIKEQIKELERNILPKNSIDTVKNSIIELKNNIYKLYKNFNAGTEKTKLNPVQKPAESEKKKAEELSNEDKIITENFDFVLENLQKIKTDKIFMQEIAAKLENILKIISDIRISTVLSRIINILNKASKNNERFDNNCYMVILQGLFLAKRFSLKDKNDYEDSYNLIMQRLAIAEDIFTPENTALSDVSSRYPDKKQKEEADNIRFSKKYSADSLQEIKTLRVDTVKLDNLISQAGELLINGIKTREHISMLAEINNKLLKWNTVSKKILSYLKYLEKKGYLSSGIDDSAGIFFRRTQNFFSSNAALLNEINSDFTELYNVISEDDNKLHQSAASVEAIAKAIRVLPLAALFHSFPRMIRDIADENNKKIDFIVLGSDTAVDKKIIEEIKMPLIHILRNSVSHGIEPPRERIKAGKKETGTVRLSSWQEENSVIITVEDDGYGVNFEKVKEKALQKGLLTAEEISHMDSKHLLKLLFLPGFSTEESVNEISGRGIGLDVVKTKIAGLNGEILIDSVLNKGCRVTIRLPLSMSTIKTFILSAGGQKYAVPVNTVKFVQYIKREQIFSRNGTASIIYEGHSMPVYSLSKLLGGEDNTAGKETLTVIIAESSGKQAAYIIDKLYGDQEVFQKKLMAPIVKIKNISGFTMLPAGEICLIINPYELIETINNFV